MQISVYSKHCYCGRPKAGIRYHPLRRHQTLTWETVQCPYLYYKFWGGFPEDIVWASNSHHCVPGDHVEVKPSKYSVSNIISDERFPLKSSRNDCRYEASGGPGYIRRHSWAVHTKAHSYRPSRTEAMEKLSTISIYQCALQVCRQDGEWCELIPRLKHYSPMMLGLY